MKDAFPIRKVIQIIGVKRDTFKTWVHRGYIEPSVYKAEGPGDQSLYNRADLYTIKMFSNLHEAGFSRNTAGLMIKGFSKTVRSQGTNFSEIAFVAFFKRPALSATMLRKSGPYFTNDHKLVSDKALAPGVRIMLAADIDKSFRSLFLTFDDYNISETYDMDPVGLEFINIVEFSRIINWVDSAIKNLDLE